MLQASDMVKSDETLDWKLSAVDIQFSCIQTPKKANVKPFAEHSTALLSRKNKTEEYCLDNTQLMLKSVLQSISPPSSLAEGDSLSESVNEDESSCRRRLARDNYCIPIYVRQQVSQIKKVVTNFVSGWRLPFVQR